MLGAASNQRLCKATREERLQGSSLTGEDNRKGFTGLPFAEGVASNGSCSKAPATLAKGGSCIFFQWTAVQGWPVMAGGISSPLPPSPDKACALLLPLLKGSPSLYKACMVSAGSEKHSLQFTPEAPRQQPYMGPSWLEWMGPFSGSVSTGPDHL